MFAGNGHWLQKCVLFRHAAMVTTNCKIKPEALAERPNIALWKTSSLHQCFGVTNLHTSVCQSRDLLKKMLTNRRKTKWYQTPQSVLTGQSGFMKPIKNRSMEDSLRVRTLNTILYKSISDLLSSHEVHAQIPGYSVEITKVSLLADYTTCRIYWKTSLSPDKDSQIQQILNKYASRIRYLLTSQQILGSVPPLVFVRDKQYAALKEVENLLAIADYGPSDDSEKPFCDGKDAKSRVDTIEKKRVLFGIDHDALYKQVEEYKQQLQDSSSQISSSASLTREQLDTLAEIRKQKLIEKKKRKSKMRKDDDITPKEFLLMRQLQKEHDENHHTDHNAEDRQASKRT